MGDEDVTVLLRKVADQEDFTITHNKLGSRHQLGRRFFEQYSDISYGLIMIHVSPSFQFDYFDWVNVLMQPAPYKPGQHRQGDEYADNSE